MPSATVSARAPAVFAAGTLLFAFDAVASRATVAGLGPMALAVLWGGHVTVVVALALLGGVAVAVERAAARLLPAARRRWIPSALTALAAAVPVHLAVSELVAGDWISKQRFAPALRVAGVAAGVAALGLLAHLYFGTRTEAAAPPARPWRRAAVPLGLFAAAATLAVADARVLPGLYAPAHLSAYGACALAAFLAACRACDELVRARRLPLALGVAAGGLVAAALAVTLFLLPRARSPLVLASRTAALVLPFVPDRDDLLATELDRLTLDSPRPAALAADRAAVDRLLGGRRDYNVVLVVVDTLRADALPPARGRGNFYAHPGDTPFLDRWLDGAFVFRRSYAQASRTRRSMPPTFRSLEACDDVDRLGSPLGAQAAALGFIPVAVVPQYFLMPESESAQQLLIGFERVDFYEKDKQQELVPKVRDLLDGVAGQRFFAWIHFYNMHEPYFAGRLQGARDGTPQARYKKALTWLDGQMQALEQSFIDAGLDNDTVVIFVADHGESLGQGGRTGHGATVFDPEIRVPMAVRIPGRRGGLVESTVGNVDVVPTLLDLAGVPPDARHHGTSLLPRLAARAEGRPPPPDVPIYFENSLGTMQGIGLGQDKLVRRDAPRVFHRFELAADGAEARDRYDPEGEVDRALRRAMLLKNPTLFADALRDEAVVVKLRRLLAAVDPEHVDLATLELLLRLAASSRDRAALAEGDRIFRASRDVAVQLLAVRHLFDTDPDRWRLALAEQLGAVAGTPAETALVDGLAHQGQSAFAMDRVARRLAAVVADGIEAWGPWLGLVAPWPKPAAAFAPPLGAMLEAIELPLPRDQVATLLLVLANVQSLEGALDASTAAALAARVAPFIDDADGRVGAEAVRAYASLAPQGAGARLRAELAEAGIDVRVRQALLYALAKVEGRAAAALIAQQGENRLLTVDAVQILGELGNPVALSFLERIAKSHYNGYTRKEARKAADKIKASARAP